MSMLIPDGGSIGYRQGIDGNGVAYLWAIASISFSLWIERSKEMEGNTQLPR